ncbi:hypothetical protein [Nocardia bovistercoris]|uniref:Uncharacterized protein n=1 Tax=Nocardia bovistercoris TaxID=2785916 RepID=A0A931I9U0_9NOCA|nr:hypothetical protein [Nocardia bovistercoris]MBH0775968.1 hypothetical protein [Nocardia bovistercoris]
MSKSPKYSTVRADAERARRLERERAERERAREAERARKAKEALDAARAATARRLTALDSACVALATQPGARSSDVDPVRAALAAARTRLEAATTVKQVGKADRAVTAAEVLRTSTSVEIARRGRRTGAEQLAAMREMLAKNDIHLRQRFDADGATRCEAVLAELSGYLERDDLGSFLGAVDSAAATVRAHYTTVTERAAEHAEQVRTANAMQEQLAARVSTLAGDAATANVSLSDIGMAEVALAEVKALVAREEPVMATELAERVAQRLLSVERDLDAAIERFTERREMLGMILEALPGLGFAVDSSSVESAPDGSVALRAVPRRGAPLLVVLHDDEEQEHRVDYIMEGADETVALDGHACGSLLDLAEALNSSLRTNGFDPGAVSWDDGGSPRIPGGARRAAATESTRRADGSR